MVWLIEVENLSCPYWQSGSLLCQHSNNFNHVCNKERCPIVVGHDRIDKNTALIVKSISNVNDTLKELLEHTKGW
ncbi:MAG: hypothetical protein M0R17_07285 [Candidatus Omnitrophica bacterium]|jgi:hypothetical protein|nr:hypothetical protein [Candidatus Omnitrophota bacterium]